MIGAFLDFFLNRPRPLDLIGGWITYAEAAIIGKARQDQAASPQHG
jgi:hypothetical protein